MKSFYYTRYRLMGTANIEESRNQSLCLRALNKTVNKAIPKLKKAAPRISGAEPIAQFEGQINATKSASRFTMTLSYKTITAAPRMAPVTLPAPPRITIVKISDEMWNDIGISGSTYENVPANNAPAIAANVELMIIAITR